MRRYLIVSVCMAILIMAAGVAEASGYTYVVVPGDNLSRIAARYGVSVQALAAANNIWNPNHIYAGMVLTIPTGYHPPHQPSYPTYPPQTPSHGAVSYYTVRPGDTLAGIARWYGTTWTSIASANGIYNPNYIYAGMVLAIPRQPTVYNYTVAYGDTLAAIAVRYGTTWSAIASYNGIYNPNHIWAGMALRIPVY
jgi:LysM repeat protein